MSTEAKAMPSDGLDNIENHPNQPYPPHFYPGPNYQGPSPPPWVPGQLPPGVAGPWPPPWGYPGAPPGWSPSASGGKISPHGSTVPMPSDEYTVDTMRRIYNDDDGRIEIQRVKVQRRQPEGSGVVFPPGGDSKSLVPVGSFPLNERRPPPRKNKMKRQMELMKSFQGQQGPNPWYPYMPCMPYPYPYPYPYYYGGGCMWPGGIPAPSLTPWPGSDDSERTTSRQESLPATLDSQRLESRVSGISNNSHSPVFQRSPSPSATTHSITPSDSISVRGYKAEDSSNFRTCGPTPPPRRSRGSTDRKQRAIMPPSDDASEVDSKSSIITTSTDIVPYQRPPRRKRKSKITSISDVSYLDQKDTDSLSDRSSIASEMTCDDSSRLNSEISYAFRKFEQSVDVFKSKVSVESTPVNTPPPSPTPIILHSKDTAVSTKDNIKVSQSEDSVGEDTDSYVVSGKDLQDKQPSTISFSSLPPLETAPSDSVSLSESKNEETGQKSTDSRQEECSQKEVTAVPEVKADTSVVSTDEVTTSVATTEKAALTTSDGAKTTDLPSVQNTDTSTEQSTIICSMPDTLPSGTAVSSVLGFTNNLQPETDIKESMDKDSKLSVPGKLEVTEAELDQSSGRDSRLSSSTFFSIRPSDDPLHIDTDSTDILLPTTDATTADEGGEGTDWTASSPVAEDTESYQWVLQQPGEIPELSCTAAGREDERRNAWRAEVSLWRARLVVSLCRGRGLDRQDWATFHLLVHHPLTLDLKLSMLHAPRLCVTNSTIGAALVRVALIHLAQYGETLLQPEASRQLGWRSIKVDPNQSWAPVKGAVEILKALGYQEREEGVLRYPRKSKTEVSVLARLTLDMLVLAEELRLYLTGTHQYPTNISDLFFPSIAASVLPDGSQKEQDLPRPPSSVGSYSYMSAHSNTSLNQRPGSQASSVTDEETDTLQVSVKQAKTTKIKQPSSSDEEVTLKEDIVNKSLTTKDASKVSIISAEKVEEMPLNANILTDNKNQLTPEKSGIGSMPSLLEQSTSSLDMSSIPDLQSIQSSTISLINPPAKEAEENKSLTPIASPLPDTAKGSEETKDNPEEHIYEEIDVIRQQVQALRASSVPVDTPPPLPPKKKVSSGGEDDSGLSLTYPHMEWTSSSMPGSLRGGSTGARRKKRRAPMPPDFMPPDWKPYENRPKEETQEKADNSADGRRRSLNPFYEDIDTVKAEVQKMNKDYENRKKAKQVKGNNNGNPFEKDEYVASGYVGKNPFYEDIEEEDMVKPKTAPRSASSTPLNTPGVCPMGSLSELQDESILIKAKRRAPIPPSSNPSSRTATPQPQKSPYSPHSPKHPPNVPPPRPPSAPPPQRKPSSPIPTHPPAIQPPKPSSAQGKTGIQDSKDKELVSEKENTKVRKTIANIIKLPLQKLHIQHPTIPPPPPPPKLEEDEEVSRITAERTTSKPHLQTASSHLEDIPYVDANEMNAEKEQKKPEVTPQYEIPELPGKDGIPPAPPLSPATLRQTALLLSGHRSVPFIDESDLPPDRPPPPPPTSPPESPTDTPKASPPETPHTSPPDTPIASQPGTPCASSPSSPITIKQVFTEPVTDLTAGGIIKDENIEILKITVHTTMPGEETSSSIKATSQISNIEESEEKSAAISTQSRLEADTAQETSTTRITEEPDEPPPLPPKSGSSQNSNDEPYANQHIKSFDSVGKNALPEEMRQTNKDSTASEETSETLEPNENKQIGENISNPSKKQEESDEQYEIPEVVRETALSIGPEGMPVRVGGPAYSHRMALESVFGPPKPPKRRNRNSSLPPPRPPKSMILESTEGIPKLPPKSATTIRPASASTTASFVTASAGSPTPEETPTSFQGTQKPSLIKQSSKTRRSWPLLFCDCMYVNCKNYEEINK